LVEDKIGLDAVLSSDRLREKRKCSRANHLCEGHNQENRIAGSCDARDRDISQPCHKVEVDDVIQSLKEHARCDRQRQSDKMRFD
jgi:hypothetical protein